MLLLFEKTLLLWILKPHPTLYCYATQIQNKKNQRKIVNFMVFQ